MKPTQAADYALFLAVIGWLVVFYGALWGFHGVERGVPDPDAAIVRLNRQVAVVLLIGSTMLFASLWLSGYAFTQARRRALFATGVCLAPVLYVFVNRVINPPLM